MNTIGEVKLNFSKLQESLKGFDWRSLKKYASPHAADDLNAFLEKLPQNAGQTMLMIAGVTWAVAGATGLFTTVQLQKLTEVRASLQEAQALKPTVPQVTDVPVNAREVEDFVAKIKDIYSGLKITANGPSISITAGGLGAFGQFREAIGHVQNGGQGWNVNIQDFCVGRECERYPLSASLRINKVSVK
ncbi:MAG: hypothetical protein H6861_02515 [Rhodospirillales bacterium]|nr:hypothetical protein [Rhodospirillales bacterium]